MQDNYYFKSFFWSTLQKILNAILGFISIPLLLGYYGKADYGILSIATACNGYMHLLDLGMNTGAIKFFSQWKAEGKTDLIHRVARTNITFYIIISIINIIILLLLAIFGKNLFAVNYEEFLQLRTCLFIICIFAIFSWTTTAFNQLLIANKQIAYTMQVQCVQTLLKLILIIVVLWANLSITIYFFWLTAILASLIIPYALKCQNDNLIDRFRPALYWNDFKAVLTFSLSIFALSVFQMTATQSRPIILSIFSTHGAETVAEFRILEVIPTFVIMIGGVFSSIFLPKTSEMVAKGNQTEISQFAYKWTSYTTILANILCVPIILCASEIISAYVGMKYVPLSKWLIIWCLTVLIQIHTTPGNALVLAYGRTKLLVTSTSVICVVSIFVNIFLCNLYGVGSAIIGYFLYVLCVIGLYYLYYYKKLMSLSRIEMVKRFLTPTIIAFIWLAIICFIPIDNECLNINNEKIELILICVIKTLLWSIPYMVSLFVLQILTIRKIQGKMQIMLK